MYEVQQTRWDRLIRRVSGSIGPGSRVSETISELFPVLDVERVPGELLILGGTNICFGGGGPEAVAGEIGFGQLENPADSGVIASISSVSASSPGLGTIRWGRTSTALGAAIGTETFRDTRRDVTTRPTCKVRSDSQPAVVGGTCQARVLGNVNLPITDPDTVMVLAPGGIFEIGSETVNRDFFFCFYWRERPAEQSELQF